MSREWVLAGVSEEELQPPPPPEQPKTPKGKWENYWYHYKWHTIGALAALVVVTVLVVQMLNRDEPDYRFALVTEGAMFSSSIDALQTELAKYGKDLDGDGKVEVLVENLYIGEDQMAAAMSQKLVVYLAAGDVMGYIFEPKAYESRIPALEENGGHFFDQMALEVPGMNEAGTYWNWKDDPVRQAEGLNLLPQELYFGVRTAVGTAGDKDSVSRHDACLELLQAFITKTQPDSAGN